MLMVQLRQEKGITIRMAMGLIIELDTCDFHDLRPMLLNYNLVDSPFSVVSQFPSRGHSWSESPPSAEPPLLCVVMCYRREWILHHSYQLAL